jgi:hypothetical protein
MEHPDGNIKEDIDRDQHDQKLGSEDEDNLKEKSITTRNAQQSSACGWKQEQEDAQGSVFFLPFCS